MIYLMLQKKLIQNLIKIIKNNKIYFYVLLLSSSALIFTFYYGYRGILPIDSFLIYDSGYKVLNGFHPFKDYWSITGPILDYIQYFFFKFFGINWFSYVFHAAIINLLVSIILFYFFIKLGLNKFFSFVYSLSASVLAYPSIGTPFMDHHAVIFSLISVMFLILSFKTDKKIYWFLIPIFLLLSFFSKQIPSSYFFLFFPVMILMYGIINSFNNFKYVYYLLLGSIISILFFVAIFIVNEIPFNNFITQYIYYPQIIGNDRGSNIILNLSNVIFQFKFIYLSMLPLSFIFVKLIKNYRKNLEIKKDLLIILLVCISILIFIYSQILTKNQILIFFLIPFCLGISHYYIKKYYNKKLIIRLLLITLIFTTLKYHLRFNENKKFMELSNVDLKLAIDAGVLDDSLKGLFWITPKYPKDPLNEINKLKEIKKDLEIDLTKKIIISDYQILPSILKLKSLAPNKWFDILSVPNKNNKYFEIYKKFFIKKLKDQNIQTVYVVGKKEVFLINIFEKNCYEKKAINKIAFKIDIKNCLILTSKN